MKERAAPHSLYLCYFGLREPLVQTQVLPYLRQLAAAGVRMTLLTFEPEPRKRWLPEEVRAWRERLAAEGIEWHFRTYHKRPSVPATLLDVIVGSCEVLRLTRRERVDVLHARAHIAMLMALLARPWTGSRVIFDLRGLIADEYADAGVWRPGSLPYRAVKWVERVGLRRADGIVVLTQRMREWLVEQGLAAPDRVDVIPCCVDFRRFGPTGGASSGSSPRPEVVYAGSVTGLYLLEEMARVFVALRKWMPGAVLRILTAAPSKQVEPALLRAGLAAEEFDVRRAEPEEVPLYLARARFGLSFRKPTFSQIAASPTKVPEYLAMGVPVICNAGVGDMDALIERERVGVVLRKLEPRAYEEAAATAMRLASEPGLRERCIAVARKYFDLVDVGGAGYLRCYERLLAAPLSPGVPERAG